MLQYFQEIIVLLEVKDVLEDEFAFTDKLVFELFFELVFEFEDVFELVLELVFE